MWHKPVLLSLPLVKIDNDKINARHVFFFFFLLLFSSFSFWPYFNKSSFPRWTSLSEKKKKKEEEEDQQQQQQQNYRPLRLLLTKKKGKQLEFIVRLRASFRLYRQCLCLGVPLYKTNSRQHNYVSVDQLSGLLLCLNIVVCIHNACSLC